MSTEPARKWAGSTTGDVLVQRADREGEPVLVPEGAAEDLVAGDAVAEQVEVARDVGALARGGHGLAEHRRLHESAVGAQPQHVAGRQVRAGLLQRLDEQLVGVRRDDVVAVAEGQVAALRVAVADTGVTGVAEAAVLLPDQLETVVGRGELGGQRGASVGGPVVDHHHLEIGQGLRREGLQTVRQEVFDVVDGDNDTEPWRHVEHVRSSRDWLSVGSTARAVAGHRSGPERVTTPAPCSPRAPAPEAGGLPVRPH